ncbi:MAG: hypothetical protein K2Y21_06805 [Phycisphaerales bacterium]|nr:hypothetical protein [Phycisphaerales bacterium]
MVRAISVTSLGLAVLVAGVAVPAAKAGVIAHDLRYTFVYQQTGATPPTVPGIYVWSSRVDLEDAGDASLASVTTPTSIGAFLFPIGESSFLASRSFASEATMNWTFPAGVYTFNLAGGGLGTISSTLSRPSQTFYPQSIPALTPGAITAIAAAPVSIDWPLSFNSFSIPASASSGVTIVTITTNANAEIYSTTLPSGANGVVIPASTMLPATGYRLKISFSAQQTSPSVGFPGATAIVAFDRQTIYAFTTRAACPADLTNDALVDDADFVLFSSAYQLLDCASPGMTPGCPADFTKDSFVDDGDFVIFAAAYEALACP